MLDSFTFGISGVLGSGKDQLTEAMTGQYKDSTFGLILGNFWVPPEVVCPKEERNKELFQLFSEEPERYAFPYQVECLANRMACQREVDRTTGILLQKQPLTVERATFGEANRDQMGELFPTYENLSRQAIATARPVDVHLYLRLTEDDLLELLGRIERSGRPGEKRFLQEPEYLRHLIRLHEDYFTSCRDIPVIRIDATHPAFRKDYEDKSHLQTIIEDAVAQVRKMLALPRFPLYHWNEIDHNTAQEAEYRGRLQLRDYLARIQRIISFAGLVSSGKTGLARLVGRELEIDVALELEGRNSVIQNPLLWEFLASRQAYRLGKTSIEEVREKCYALQVDLIEKRPATREELFAEGRSFAEDRSIEEDSEIFWPLFLEQGFLTREQFSRLEQKAGERYARTKKADILIQTGRPALDCKVMSLRRGRGVEQEAWTIEDMLRMENYFACIDGKSFLDRAMARGALKGPRFAIDMTNFDPDKKIHLGWLWQEIMHELLT